MQANVKEILTAAEATELFETVKDRPIVRKDDFPCFMILGRHKDPESFNTALNHYNGPWEYQCLIATKMDKDQVDDENHTGADFVQLENLERAFFEQLLGDGEWELVAGPDHGGYSVISGSENLGSAFTLAKHQTDRY